MEVYFIFFSAEGYVSVQRLQDFLMKCEGIPEGEQNTNKLQEIAFDDVKSSKHRKTDNNSSQKGLNMENVSAVWSSSKKSGIFDINLNITQGLYAIIGQVGSGKSTLLNAILGEIKINAGECTINGKMSYSAQEPWLFEGTIRNNIIFVDEYNDERYRKVIEVCALDRDLKLLGRGDQTIVGERGISLSGGQKARISLARAIYKQADIYLLDDPLSAVDSHVGKQIYEKCITDYLNDKICVLVTHQLQYLKNVEHVVLMRRGKIEKEGSYQSVYGDRTDAYDDSCHENNRNEVF